MTQVMRHNGVTAPFIEFFSSIQGEGLHVGRRHLFVRFGACNLTCNYCDTPEWMAPPERCRVYDTGAAYHELDNPLTASQAAEVVREFAAREGLPDAVSLTGGEPLLHADFLLELLPALKADGQRIYLETNGVLPKALERVHALVDVIAMDIKLPRYLKGNRSVYAEHREFLKRCRGRETFVKVVFDSGATDGELLEAARVVAECDDAIPFVLQPVTAYGPVTGIPSPERRLEAQNLLRGLLKDVRVIPQTHVTQGLK